MGKTSGKSLFVKKEDTRTVGGRFEHLFKTARTLLESRADEDLILPTLCCEARQVQDGGGVWAKLRGSLVRSWEDRDSWDSAVGDFTERYGRVRPAKVVNGTLILERLPVAVKVWEEPNREVWIEIMPRVRPATADQVAAEYDRVLTRHGIRHNEDLAISMTSDLKDENHLRIILKPVFRGIYISDSPPREPFPSAAMVAHVVGGLVQGRIRENLTARQRGIDPAPIHVVTAMTAFFLRTIGDVESPKRIHQLLNKHLYERRVFREDVVSAREANQLLNNIKAMHVQIVRTMYSL